MSKLKLARYAYHLLPFRFKLTYTRGGEYFICLSFLTADYSEVHVTTTYNLGEDHEFVRCPGEGGRLGGEVVGHVSRVSRETTPRENPKLPGLGAHLELGRLDDVSDAVAHGGVAVESPGVDASVVDSPTDVVLAVHVEEVN